MVVGDYVHFQNTMYWHYQKLRTGLDNLSKFNITYLRSKVNDLYAILYNLNYQRVCPFSKGWHFDNLRNDIWQFVNVMITSIGQRTSMLQGAMLHSEWLYIHFQKHDIRTSWELTQIYKRNDTVTRLMCKNI